MRISDWSSDVCSSDLQILLEDLPGVAADPAVGAIAVESVGSWLSAAAPATVLLTVGAAARPTSIIGTLSHRSLASEWMTCHSRHAKPPICDFASPEPHNSRSEELRVGKACDSTCRSR